jgi:hypothetical protein
VGLERPAARGQRGTAEIATQVRVAVGGVEASVGRASGGRGEEPLEIADPVAPIATRVDAVIAETPGVAPCADRVRVNTEQASGLGDGQGRV